MGHAMQERGIDMGLRGKLPIGGSQRSKGDGHAAGSRSCDGSEHVRRHGQRNVRTAADAEHPILDKCKARQGSDDGTSRTRLTPLPVPACWGTADIRISMRVA